MKNLVNCFYEPCFIKETDGLTFDEVQKKEQKIVNNLTDIKAYQFILNDFEKMKEQGIAKVSCHSDFLKSLIKAAIDAEIKATICLGLSAKDGITTFDELEEFFLKIKNINENIDFALYVPNALCEVDYFERILSFSKIYDLPIFIETSKTLDEVGNCAKLNNNNTPIMLLNEMGLIGPQTTLIHCNYLEEEDEEIIALNGAKVAITPLYSANNGLGQANIVSLINLGVDVSVASFKSDCFDLFKHAQFTCLYQKVNMKDASCLNKKTERFLIKTI